MSYDNFLDRQLDAEHQREIDEDNRHQRVMYQMANLNAAQLNTAMTWLSDEAVQLVMRKGLRASSAKYHDSFDDNQVGRMMDEISDKEAAMFMRISLSKDGMAREEIYQRLLRGVKL